MTRRMNLSSRTIYCGLLALLLNAAIQPASAHNSWIALAYPMPAIEVAGDLSDWPTDATVYPIRQNTDAYGETDLSGTDLDTSADLSPEFMVGYKSPAAGSKSSRWTAIRWACDPIRAMRP